MRVFALAMLLLLVAGTAAQAGLTAYTDRALFESEGTIYEEWNFADWPRNQWNYPGMPYTTHGVTYLAPDGELLIAGADMLGAAENYILNNYWTPLHGSIDLGPGYDMFGWDFAGPFSGGNCGIVIHTSVSSYNYTVYAPGPPGFVFVGYIADAGETIEGFELSSDGSIAPSMTWVTLGIREPTATETTSWSELKALY